MRAYFLYTLDKLTNAFTEKEKLEFIASSPTPVFFLNEQSEDIELVREYEDNFMHDTECIETVRFISYSKSLFL